jgi:hypothetical protein
MGRYCSLNRCEMQQFNARWFSQRRLDFNEQVKRPAIASQAKKQRAEV